MICVKEESIKPLKAQMDIITGCERAHRINKRRHIHINITYISTSVFPQQFAQCHSTTELTIILPN
jgi:hypothetical protein